MSIILEGIDIHEKFESARLILERNEKDGTIRVINESSGEYIGHAIQVPKGHGRLIDADELKESIEEVDRPSGYTALVHIQYAPTILEAEE